MSSQPIVIKFGGSSMCIKGYITALNRVKELVNGGYRVTVVVSAVGKTTNALMDIVNLQVCNIDKIREINCSLIKELKFDEDLLANEFNYLTDIVKEFLSNPSTDLVQSRIKILSMGEIISSIIMHHYLSKHFDNNQLGLLNARHFIKSKNVSAKIDPKTLHMGGEFYCDSTAFNKIFNKSWLVAVSQGYIATTDDNKHCVLSRSGSDTSASLIAQGIGAERLEIWTDVNGMYTADPRVVPSAKVIHEIDYKICCEASASGSHVLHPYCIEPCMNKNIPIYVKNTFDPEGICTVVKNIPQGSPYNGKIHTIAQQKNVTIFNIKSDMWQSAGATGQVFKVFSENCVDVDIITTSHTSISTTTEEMNRTKLDNVCTELSKHFQVEIIENCTIVSIVADNAQTNHNINNAINIVNKVCSTCNHHCKEGCFYIKHYSSNNMNLSFVINSDYSDKLVRAFHQEYLENHYNNEYIQPNNKDIITVAINGHKGRLGSLIVNSIYGRSDMVFNEELFNTNNIDVIIDVSSPEGTINLIKNLVKNKKNIPLVIGTTGHSIDDINIINKYSMNNPVALIPNFSKGIPLFEKFIKSIQNTDQWTASLLDDHHILKKDAPSGTAKKLMSSYSGHINIHSKREGDTIGTHTLELDSPTETLIIQHIAKDRKIFSEGAIEYCKWIIGQTKGLYSEMTSISKPQYPDMVSQTKMIKFSKYESGGNDFIITPMSNRIPDNITEFVKKYCNRHTGIGADGLIFVNTTQITDNKIEWEIYNCDGSIAEMCGNGALCCLKYLYDNKIYDKDSYNYKLTNSFSEIDGCYDVDNGGSSIFLPFPTDYQDVGNNTFTLTMGVPHAVKFPKKCVIEPKNPKFNNKYIGKYNMNTFGYYGDLDSLSITEINEINVKVRTFECGVNNETFACGTGCCAVAYCLYKRYNKDTFNIETLLQNTCRVEIFEYDNTIMLINRANNLFNTSILVDHIKIEK